MLHSQHEFKHPFQIWHEVCFDTWTLNAEPSATHIRMASAAMGYLFDPPANPSLSLQRWLMDPKSQSCAIKHTFDLFGECPCDIAEETASKIIAIISACAGNQDPACLTWVKSLSQEQFSPLLRVATGAYLPDGLAFELACRLLQLPSDRPEHALLDLLSHTKPS